MKQTTLITIALALLVLTAGTLPAQVEPAPFISLHFDRIDPAQSQEFEAINKKWVEAFAGAKVGKEFYWRAYQSGFSYVWVSDMPNYSYLDQQEARQKVLSEKLGEGKLEELEAGAGGAVIEHYNEIWKYQPDMSYQAAGFNPAEMGAINVAVVDVKPSMDDEYREVVKEAIAALAKVEAPNTFFGYSTPFGDGSYAFVSWGEDRGALHSGPEIGGLLVEAMGEEKAQELFTRYMNCVAGEEDRDWRVRADLAYVTDGMMEEEPAE